MTARLPSDVALAQAEAPAEGPQDEADSHVVHRAAMMAAMAAPGVINVTGWAADAEALADFLGEPNLCRIGTIDADGDPHVTPAWFWWDGERFWVGAEAADRKVANIRRTRRAAIEVDSDLRRKRGVLARGKARLYTGAAGTREYIRITAEQIRRYQPDKPPRETAEKWAAKGGQVVIEVKPDSIVSWGR